jgi:hypothetical protein
LPPAQRALVAGEIDRLTPSYIQMASQTALDLNQAHDPIRGLGDEIEIERAYFYLQHAYALGNDPSLKDRMDALGDKLSGYYLDQAKHFLERPSGSGAGVAWSFVEKALPYKASNLPAIRDERTLANPSYQVRSKLSIRVVFHDQTSRRDSTGFAEQLADAIAAGLETSGLPVKVFRQGDSSPVEPNFQLIGDVIQHYQTQIPTSSPKDSKYRAGEQEVPNEDWNKANREYESATLDVDDAHAALLLANTHGKKKEIADAAKGLAVAQQKVKDTHAKLDEIPKTKPIDIEKPYTYNEITFELKALVELQYRIIDSAITQVVPGDAVKKDVTKSYTVLENVKPEDTQGIKSQQVTKPDENQFRMEVENSARDELIKKVKDSVAKLPEKILEQARKRVEEGDSDGAAEAYILYLNSTHLTRTPERQEAEKFLLDKFNIRLEFSADK